MISASKLAIFGLSAAAAMAHAGQVSAAERGYDRNRGFDRGCDNTSRGLRVGFGFSEYGSGVSFNFGNRGGYCAPVRSYCEPVRSYCEPVRSYCEPVYVRPYCPPVIVNRYDYCPPRTIVYSDPVIVERPEYVERPVYVERQVVVLQPAPQQVPRPVIVEQQVQQPVVTQAVYTSPEVRQPAPVVVQPTYRDRELGDAYLRMGDPDNAVRVYSKYLSAWNADGTAVRNMGFAQIARGDAGEGVKFVVRGYQLEPSMAQRPLAKSDFGGEGSFQKTLDNATGAAAGNNTPEAWLTVAILQHVANQKEQSINALQRSRDAGLDKTLLDQFTLELSK